MHMQEAPPPKMEQTVEQDAPIIKELKALIAHTDMWQNLGTSEVRSFIEDNANVFIQKYESASRTPGDEKQMRALVQSEYDELTSAAAFKNLLNEPRVKKSLNALEKILTAPTEESFKINDPSYMQSEFSKLPPYETFQKLGVPTDAFDRYQKIISIVMQAKVPERFGDKRHGESEYTFGTATQNTWEAYLCWLNRDKLVFDASGNLDTEIAKTWTIPGEKNPFTHVYDK